MAYELRISDWSSDVCSSDLIFVVLFIVVGVLLLILDLSFGWFIMSLAALPAVYIEWYRSEEHTSELQSLMRISYAVFCLKKKKSSNKNITLNIILLHNPHINSMHQYA